MINKPSQIGGKPTKPVKVAQAQATDDEEDKPDTSSKIISKWTYTKNISNSFARGQCTWYAAIISPNIFPYVDEDTQTRTF